MKRKKEVVFTLLAALALPALAAAADEAVKAKPVVATPKPVIAAPVECKVKSKVRASEAHEKRRAEVAKRQAAGLGGEKVEFNPNALKNLDKRRKPDHK